MEALQPAVFVECGQNLLLLRTSTQSPTFSAIVAHPTVFAY